FEEVDPHNRPPPTFKEETKFAPPMVQIADVDDVPIPHVIQFGSNFHIGESSAMRDLLVGNSKVYAPGQVCCDLKSVDRGVMKLSKQMHDRYRKKKKMERKIRQDELRMNGQEFNITALDLAIESIKSSTEPPIVNEFFVINIPEEDVKTQQIIIIDPDDQPIWESAKTIAPTPNFAIVQPNIDDNFVINSTHLKMIWENKFDGYLRAYPHDHICEFFAICEMFKYGETQSETVKLLMFQLSVCDKAKTWFNELNEKSITSWDQMR
nr:hypothetical protein [Tanacetum cinerariifolium]